MPPSSSNQVNHSVKSSITTSSPFKNNNKTSSKDLESYILRNSTETLKLANYNFKEIDNFEHRSNSNSPQQDKERSKLINKSKKKKGSSSNKEN